MLGRSFNCEVLLIVSWGCLERICDCCRIKHVTGCWINGVNDGCWRRDVVVTKLILMTGRHWRLWVKQTFDHFCHQHPLDQIRGNKLWAQKLIRYHVKTYSDICWSKINKNGSKSWFAGHRKSVGLQPSHHERILLNVFRTPSDCRIWALNYHLSSRRKPRLSVQFVGHNFIIASTHQFIMRPLTTAAQTN